MLARNRHTAATHTRILFIVTTVGHGLMVCSGDYRAKGIFLLRASARRSRRLFSVESGLREPDNRLRPASPHDPARPRIAFMRALVCSALSLLLALSTSQVASAQQKTI